MYKIEVVVSLAEESVNEYVIAVKCQVSNFAVYKWQEQVSFWWDDDDICFVQDQHIPLDF